MICGAGKRGFAEGTIDAAEFNLPFGVCLVFDDVGSNHDSAPNQKQARSAAGVGAGAGRVVIGLMCADLTNERIRHVSLLDGSVSTYVGVGKRGSGSGSGNGTTTTIVDGPRLTVSLNGPRVICGDPFKPGSYYISDIATVRYCDGATGIVSLIAGDGMLGCADGVGSAARFSYPYGLLCTSSSSSSTSTGTSSSSSCEPTLFVSDNGNTRLRSIDIKTRTVKSLGDTGWSPSQLCFDRSPTTKPESVIYIATPGGLQRFDLATATRTAPVLKNKPAFGFALFGIVCTSSGVLIASNYSMSRLLAIRIASGEVEQIPVPAPAPAPAPGMGADTSSAGGGGGGGGGIKLSWPLGLTLSESDRMLYVANSDTHQIIGVELSTSYFN